MKIVRSIVVASACLLVAQQALIANAATNTKWRTVANNGDPMPNSAAGRTFNSFNQPSVNAKGVVVFRARSRGGPPEGQPTRGIYVRDMNARNSAIRTIAGGDTPVPFPSNIVYPPDDLPTSFIEFPSIPRIGINSSAIATRGNHQPVWEYAETRAGTTGIYVNLNGIDPLSELVTGASKLGAIPEFDFFKVPGLDATPFDVFPGAPSITDNRVIVFKGNYTDATAKTGVFYRRLEGAAAGGSADVEMIASSDTEIPYDANCEPGTRFGSTAPPSAALDQYGKGRVVFVGLDNEETPGCGGIYSAPLSPSPVLTPLVRLGAPVPGEALGTTFNLLGEGLSFDGRFVGFWGAWGDDTRTLRLYCPQEGSKDRRDYCNNAGRFSDGSGDPNSICDDASDDSDSCYQERQIPLNQGIFVHDTRTAKTYAIARTAKDFDDFVYWVYSGRVPGSGGEGGEGEEDGGEDDGEAARWRSSAFVAVSGRGAAAWVAFKARTGEISPDNNTYDGPVDGIYAVKKPGVSSIMTLVDTTTPGRLLDLEATAESTVAAVGMERDGFRGQWLVINASMGEEGGEEEDGTAGIYLTRLP